MSSDSSELRYDCLRGSCPSRCSWRAISLSTPRLWARIHVVEPPRGSRFGSAGELIDKKAAERLEVTKMWLGRSGQCPLSVSLYIGPNMFSHTFDSGALPQRSIPTCTRCVRAALATYQFNNVCICAPCQHRTPHGRGRPYTGECCV
ncbi:hypothetical protein B0H19DRAFT_222519 [Mycena capillaripes]|nr:hypothetical protein B0H19DRAFT_222519 [Mycena capillaripes]